MVLVTSLTSFIIPYLLGWHVFANSIKPEDLGQTNNANLRSGRDYEWHYAINACLAPLYSVEGMHVITVEGLGSCKRGLHPVQESLACAHGSQCGFCTPDFIMSMYSLLRSNRTPPSQEQIEECLAGNLCRCTGYRPILDAFQVTGEAEYADDTPLPPNGLHAALVLSRKPHAQILTIDDSGAKSSPGFLGIFLAKDVPGNNKIGPVVADEELFATEYITCVGQVTGVVVADTHENAKLAAREVHVEYEEPPAILSIEEAINAKSFHPNTQKCLRKGNVDHCFQSGQCDRIIEGQVQIGGQEHFYLEPNSSLVWTVDGGNEVHMISSTQVPQKHQKYVSHVLGLPMSKVGFTNEGKMLALDLEIYLAILERAIFHSDNVYEIPNMRIMGRVCFTNFPSHTAFRGFGGPQGMLIAENWISRIATELKKSPEEIREINFQGEGYVLHYGQELQHCTLTPLWNEKLSCDFVKVREEVNLFNGHNRWKKSGIAMVPTKFGISFTVA